MAWCEFVQRNRKQKREAWTRKGEVSRPRIARKGRARGFVPSPLHTSRLLSTPFHPSTAAVKQEGAAARPLSARQNMRGRHCRQEGRRAGGQHAGRGSSRAEPPAAEAGRRREPPHTTHTTRLVLRAELTNGRIAAPESGWGRHPLALSGQSGGAHRNLVACPIRYRAARTAAAGTCPQAPPSVPQVPTGVPEGYLQQRGTPAPEGRSSARLRRDPGKPWDPSPPTRPSPPRRGAAGRCKGEAFPATTGSEAQGMRL